MVAGGAVTEAPGAALGDDGDGVWPIADTAETNATPIAKARIERRRSFVDGIIPLRDCGDANSRPLCEG